MKYIVLFLLGLPFTEVSIAQTDNEFPKEFIMHLKLHNGMVSQLNSSPNLYVGALQVVPQYTIVKNKIRAGLIADVYYTGNQLQAAVGPTVSFKIKSFNLKSFGSGGNLHINLDHLWGTNQERLFGGAVNADLLNKIVVGFSVHRDYHLNTWWFQNSIGIRISKLRKVLKEL